MKNLLWLFVTVALCCLGALATVRVASTTPRPPTVSATAVAPVYRGTPEILRMADWPGGRPSDAELARLSTEPGVMRPAEDDPLEYGLNFNASERAARAAGSLLPVSDQLKGEAIPAPRAACAAETAIRAAARLLGAPRAEFISVTEDSFRADQDERSYSGVARLYDEGDIPRKDMVVWSISVARKKGVWTADDESFQKSSPRRVSYPLDSGPRPAPLRRRDQ